MATVKRKMGGQVSKVTGITKKCLPKQTGYLHSFLALRHPRPTLLLSRGLAYSSRRSLSEESTNFGQLTDLSTTRDLPRQGSIPFVLCDFGYQAPRFSFACAHEAWKTGGLGTWSDLCTKLSYCFNFMHVLSHAADFACMWCATMQDQVSGASNFPHNVKS